MSWRVDRDTCFECWPRIPVVHVYMPCVSTCATCQLLIRALDHFNGHLSFGAVPFGNLLCSVLHRRNAAVQLCPWVNYCTSVRSTFRARTDTVPRVQYPSPPLYPNHSHLLLRSPSNAGKSAPVSRHPPKLDCCIICLPIPLPFPRCWPRRRYRRRNDYRRNPRRDHRSKDRRRPTPKSKHTSR